MHVLFSLLLTLAAPPRLSNHGFEETITLPESHAALTAGWTLDAERRAPTAWSLNTAYPGQLAIMTEGSAEGQQHIAITAPAGRDTHLYQMVEGLAAGQWYRVTVQAKGGPSKVYCYEYRASGLRVFALAEHHGGAAWRTLTGYYSPVGEEFQRAAIALTVPPGQTVAFDNLRVEALDLPAAPDGLADLTFETSATRLVVTGQGRVTSFVDRASGTDYAPTEQTPPLLIATVDGAPRPLHTLTRDGDLLRAQFIEPGVTATLRVTTRPHHLLFEVIEASGTVDELQFALPVRRLATVARTFNGTYDDQFGICVFGTTYQVENRSPPVSAATVAFGGRCVKKHGLVGSGFAVVAAPWAGFKAAIREAEKANGLPSPERDGAWMRDSEAVRKSYLFTTGTKEADLDTLIEYAKIGGFGTMLWLKNDWLANHGHYDINTANFPDGMASIQRGVAKLHAAGLEAGVHLFGPTISPNDPYVTPQPDNRLATVDCPPLAEAIDAKATTITLTGPPPLPPIGPSSRAHPGQWLRIGDEIIAWGSAEVGPPFRYTNCRRGALGTAAAAYDAGTAVKGLLALWGFFCIDPATTLADEVTDNLARVVREAGFDFLYMDAAEGHNGPYFDGWYASNKLHGELYRKIGRDDLLYQTSQGSGVNLLFHLVPRSASADGHGDIKGYLDDRWPGISGMPANFTTPDIGWYYWFREVRPDQIEYVCAKALGIDGSISLETSKEALERLTQSRQMMEMIGRWERCRAANVFDPETKELLKVQQRDFRLFDDGQGGWRLYEAVYEEPRQVEQLDGTQNRWAILNDRPEPVTLALELVRGDREQSAGAYDAPAAKPFPALDDPGRWQLGPTNDYARYVVGAGAVTSGLGVARDGVMQSLTIAPEPGPGGQPALVYAADNQGADQGWSGIGMKLEPPPDLSGLPLFAIWLHGDQKDEQVRIQLRDTAGQFVDHVETVTYPGWRLVTFPLAKEGFDAAKVEFLMLYFNNLRGKQSVAVRVAGPRAVPRVAAPEIEGLRLSINGREVSLIDRLPARTALTAGAPDGATFWPGGMQPGRPVTLSGELKLAPGPNEVILTSGDPERFGGDLAVLVSRSWPVE